MIKSNPTPHTRHSRLTCDLTFFPISPISDFRHLSLSLLLSSNCYIALFHSFNPSSDLELAASSNFSWDSFFGCNFSSVASDGAELFLHANHSINPVSLGLECQFLTFARFLRSKWFTDPCSFLYMNAQSWSILNVKIYYFVLMRIQWGKVEKISIPGGIQVSLSSVYFSFFFLCYFPSTFLAAKRIRKWKKQCFLAAADLQWAAGPALPKFVLILLILY